MRPASAVALLFLLLASSEARRSHSRDSRNARHRQHEDVEEYTNHLSRQEEQDECHRVALHKCGQTFLRAHKLLSYLGDDSVALRTRCGVRTAFFECLKTTRDRICGRPPKPHHHFRLESDFRKKLTDTLWSTRVCVLGVQSFQRQR